MHDSSFSFQCDYFVFTTLDTCHTDRYADECLCNWTELYNRSATGILIDITAKTDSRPHSWRTNRAALVKRSTTQKLVFAAWTLLCLFVSIYALYRWNVTSWKKTFSEWNPQIRDLRVMQKSTDLIVSIQSTELVFGRNEAEPVEWDKWNSWRNRKPLSKLCFKCLTLQMEF